MADDLKSAASNSARPFGPFERMLALRYIRARRAEGFVSVVAGISFLGILIGIGALILISAIMGGVRENNVNQILGLNGHITVTPVDGLLPVEAATSEVLTQTDRIQRIVPIVQADVLLTSGFGQSEAIARGMPAEQLRDGGRFFAGVPAGDMAAVTGWRAALSLDLAAQLGVGVGDKVDVISAKGNQTPFGWTPRIKDVEIAALVTTGRNGKGGIFLPLDKAQIFFRAKQQLTQLELVVAAPRDIDGLTDHLQQQLGADVRVQSWKHFNRVFVTALDIERIATYIILTFVVIVAAFNILTGQSMLVRDKARGVAILRTMGATPGAILRIFIMSGAAVGTAGTLIGAVTGFALAFWFQNIIGGLLRLDLPPAAADVLDWLSAVDPVLNPSSIAFTVLLGIGLSVLATLLPAREAASLDPIEALRHE